MTDVIGTFIVAAVVAMIAAPHLKVLEHRVLGTDRFVVSRWTLLWAALILVVGFAASGSVAYAGSHARSNSYDAQIGPVVGRYNEIIRRWNVFVDEFNAYTPALPGQADLQAAGGLALTNRLANDAQLVIADWNAVTPPRKLAESHQLAGEAMRTTQSAFLEMSVYLEDVVKHGVAFSDRAEAASSKLDEASRLLDRARASARAAR
jgi:hypothetical protein